IAASACGRILSQRCGSRATSGFGPGEKATHWPEASAPVAPTPLVSRGSLRLRSTTPSVVIAPAPARPRLPTLSEHQDEWGRPPCVGGLQFGGGDAADVATGALFRDE